MNKTAMQQLIEMINAELSEPDNGTKYIEGFDDAMRVCLKKAKELMNTVEREREQQAKELAEALEEIKNMETSGSRFDILRIVNKALTNYKQNLNTVKK